VLKYFWEPCGIIIIIILYSIFITNFESPETYLPVKIYANYRLCTFQTLNLESVLLANLPYDVILKFQPL